MSEVFNTQSLLTISLDTKYASLNSADSGTTKILYEKPSGEKGAWTATINGTKLQYNLQNGDIDEVGDWKFESYFEVGGYSAPGAIVTKYFKKPLL